MLIYPDYSQIINYVVSYLSKLNIKTLKTFTPEKIITPQIVYQTATLQNSKFQRNFIKTQSHTYHKLYDETFQIHLTLIDKNQNINQTAKQINNHLINIPPLQTDEYLLFFKYTPFKPQTDTDLEKQQISIQKAVLQTTYPVLKKKQLINLQIKTQNV